MPEIALLFAGSRSDGSAVLEEVVVTSLGTGRFRVMQSPGLVLGIAADDVIEISEDRRAIVMIRGGNLCIQVYPRGKGVDLETVLSGNLAPLGGRLDGRSTAQLVFTVPASAGFPAVEAALNGAVAKFPGAEWYFGNVYDVDGVTPLNWWLH